MRKVGITTSFWWCVCVQLALVGMALLAPYVGIHVAWGGSIVVWLFVALLLAWWALYAVTPSRPFEQGLAEGLLAFALWISLTMTAPPAQYVALTTQRPLIDSWLASVDSSLGISVKATAAWLSAHPHISHWMTRAYVALFPQLVLIVPVLVLLRQRQCLREYIFHFHVCTAITVAALALWPAAGAFQYLGFTSTIPQERFIEHFVWVRSGNVPTLEIGRMEGMVSFPSFHLAGGWMVTWALRRTRLLWPVLGLNVALSVATIASGAHYFADALGTVAMTASSLALWRLVGEPARAEHGTAVGDAPLTPAAPAPSGVRANL